MRLSSLCKKARARRRAFVTVSRMSLDRDCRSKRQVDFSPRADGYSGKRFSLLSKTPIVSNAEIMRDFVDEKSQDRFHAFTC